MIKFFPPCYSTRHVRIMGKIESACFEYLNTKILVGACFFTFFEKFVWLFVHVKITRNIRQPPTTLEKSSNIFLDLFAHSMCKFRILFQNSSNFVVRFLFLKITQNPLSFFSNSRKVFFEKALFKINQKSFKTLMGFVPKLRAWFVPKSPNLGFVPKVPKFPDFLPPPNPQI